MCPTGGEVEQYAETDEETRVSFESLINNFGIEIEKCNTVNRELKVANEKLFVELESYKENAKTFRINKQRESELEIGYRDSVIKNLILNHKLRTYVSWNKTINL